MAHSFANLLHHVIFSTKDRSALIDSDLAPRLHAYLGGIVDELNGVALAIGGAVDHVHLLIKLPATVALADAIRIIKTNSSKWVHDTWPDKRAFAWRRVRGIQRQSIGSRRRSRVHRGSGGPLSARLVPGGIRRVSQAAWD